MIDKVEVKNVSLTFHDVDVLKNINFSLDNKGIYGLVGRNGAGKTSLLSLLAAYQPVTSGAITIDGETIFENEQAMANISFIYPIDYKDEYDTIADFFKLAKRYRPTFDTTYAEQLVELFQLPMDKSLKKLSTGMQSAFNVTMGLANRTPITIFDEAYQGMDAPTRDIFYQEILEEQARNPRIFILSTHLVSEMEYLFDYIFIIHRGELMIQEGIDSLLEKGFSITGTIEDVQQVTKGLHVINERTLGGTKSVMVYGELTENIKQRINQMGLEHGHVSLHDLFIQLTKEAK